MLSQHKESHGSHGNFYEGEQEQCHCVPAGVLCGGLRISQWHKLCWSRASVTLAGTTGQLSLSRNFPGPTSNPYLPPAPAYMVLVFVVVFQLQFAMLGDTLTSRASLVKGCVNTTHFSLGAVHCTNGFETWRVHYMVDVTSSARNQAESSILPTLHWENPIFPSPHKVWVGVAGSSSSCFVLFYQAWPWVVSVLIWTTSAFGTS